jgi:hypothetical protein
MSFLRFASVFVFVAGCALDELAEPVTQEIGAGSCGAIWTCGGNSPEVAHLGLHDLHGRVGGQKTENGFHVTAIERRTCTSPPGPVVCSTKQYDSVSSSLGVLTATGPSGTITGASVKGLVIRLTNATNGVKYVLTIANVGVLVPLWSKSPVFPGSESWQQYDIQWDVERPPGVKMDWKAVCTNPPSDGNPDLLGMNPYHSLVFEDDWIDARSKTVRGKRKETNWINIGCAGHTLAKMVLTGNVSATNTRFGYTASFENMTTVAKMYSADYCGRGKPFTVAGISLGVYSATVAYRPAAYRLEGPWTPKGIACLNVPRVLANPTPLSKATFNAATFEAEIAAECGGTRPPPCPSTDPYATGGTYIVSSNPI